MKEQKSFPFGQEFVWTPSEHDVASSNLAAFMHRHALPDYSALLLKAREEPEWFWAAVLSDLGIRFETPYEKVLSLDEGAAFARWCLGGRMNIVESCLRRWLDAPERVALRWEGEAGETKILTYRALHHEVCRCAGALRERGFGKGDVAALLMPMTPEIVVAFLATLQVGGIVLPLFSGFGPQAVATRLEDAEARVLFTAAGFSRRGRWVALKDVADQALELAPTVKHVIVAGASQGVLLKPGRDVVWEDALRSAWDERVEICDAEDPSLLIYTSGTTGKPKGAVHTHCGFPVKAAQDLWMAMDFKSNDTLFWFTDMGWMMGPWEIFGAFVCGGTLVLYDGAPDWPTPRRLWEVVERHGVTHLGVSPVLVRALMGHGRPQDISFDRLRALCSTGSPWDPESWMWAFQEILGSGKPILNYSGGTEVSGGIVCGNFVTPLKPCAFSGPIPGMAADVVDEQGNPVRGRVGELVLRGPWIGMTRGFWRDWERYFETYWARIPGVWMHGDYAAIDEDGLWYILGRSDATIKIAGKRLGPAEVEAIVNANAHVVESAAIGVPHPVKDQEIVVFCVLRAAQDGVEKVREEIVDELVRGLGKSFKPREVRICSALPKTRNAKVMHRVIRSAYLGEPLGDLSGLEDPRSVQAIVESR